MRKTGDKFIIVENGEPMYVIAPFAEYDRMVNSGMYAAKNTFHQSTAPLYQPVPTTPGSLEPARPSDEEKLLEKVNQDIAEFRSKQDSGKAPNKAQNKDEQYYIEPVEQP